MQDGGDPAVDVSPRDIVYTMPADQASNGAGPQKLAQTNLRYATPWSSVQSILAVVLTLCNVLCAM